MQFHCRLSIITAAYILKSLKNGFWKFSLNQVRNIWGDRYVQLHMDIIEFIITQNTAWYQIVPGKFLMNLLSFKNKSKYHLLLLMCHADGFQHIFLIRQTLLWSDGSSSYFSTWEHLSFLCLSFFPYPAVFWWHQQEWGEVA
jgi:hypothetical protein